MTKIRLRSLLFRCRNLAFCLMGAAMASPAGAAAPEAVPADHVVGQPQDWRLGLQHGVTPVKAQMAHFHDVLLMPLITGIVVLVLGLMLYVAIRFNAKSNPVPSKTTHNTMLEVVWTLVPVVILVIIVIPSMKMLYYADRTADAEMTLKVTGYQWYWGYEYPDHGEVSFLSNLLQEDELKEGQPRLLATDNPVVLPVDTNIRLLITANDVLHAWAMPAFGVKIDAVPGRTNETWTRIEKEGVYYGQCSEICGVNHAFMPIEVHAVSKEAFAEWIEAQGGTMPQPGAALAAPVPGTAADETGVPADVKIRTPAEMTPTDEAVNESVKEEGNVVEDVVKEASEPMPSKKAGEE